MKNKSPVLVLHGISEGAQSEFIQKIVSEAERQEVPVTAINFPYMDRGETSPSKDLTEEVQSIANTVNQLTNQYPGEVHIVAKSLGGVAASFYLTKNRDPRVKKLTILGAVLGDLKINGLHDYEIDVIQGQNDRFGPAEKVKKVFDSAGVPLHRLIEIEGADHSYRDENRLPSHQDKAVESIEF